MNIELPVSNMWVVPETQIQLRFDTKFELEFGDSSGVNDFELLCDSYNTSFF